MHVVFYTLLSLYRNTAHIFHFPKEISATKGNKDTVTTADRNRILFKVMVIVVSNLLRVEVKRFIIVDVSKI